MEHAASGRPRARSSRHLVKLTRFTQQTVDELNHIFSGHLRLLTILAAVTKD